MNSKEQVSETNTVSDCKTEECCCWIFCRKCSVIQRKEAFKTPLLREEEFYEMIEASIGG